MSIGSQKLRDKQKSRYENRNSYGNQGKRVFVLGEKHKDVSFYEVKEGVNNIDILPFIVATDNYPDKKVVKGDMEYVLDFWAHRYVGAGDDTFLCLKRSFGHRCPICEEMEKLKSDGADKKLVASLRPTHRVAYNVLDLDEEDKGIQIFVTSHYLFEKELQEEAYADDPEGVDFVTLEEGHSILFRGAKESFDKREFLKYKNFRFKKRKPYQSTDIKESVPLDEIMYVPSYDDVYNSFFLDGDDPIKTKNQTDYTKPPFETEKPVQEESRFSRKRHREPEPEKEETKCPAGFAFGKDTDNQKECQDCEEWENCAKEFDTNKGKK